MTKENIVTVDDKDYNIDELSDSARHCILRIREYDRKVNTIKLEMDEIRFITDNYLQTLRKELENAKPILQQDSQTEGDPEKKN